jgi:hypothetical protein
MNHGTIAIAVVQHQVMIIQGTCSSKVTNTEVSYKLPAARSHDSGDRWLDVCTYTPFGDHLFLASSVPHARIASSDVLIVFPFHTATTDMIDLPAQAYQKFLQLNAKHQKKQENLWRGWKARLR